MLDCKSYLAGEITQKRFVKLAPQIISCPGASTTKLFIAVIVAIL
jgi:hypothetical protein